MSVERSPTLERVLRGQLCSGCGLCASVGGEAITMEVAPPGYNRPRQLAPISEETEAVITDGCPGSKVAPWTRIGAPAVHPFWGPYRSVAMGHSTDETLRHRASSGGLLSALLIRALETGAVDAVLHVGADPEHPTRNVIRFSRTAAEVMSGAGSRYAPSSPLEPVVGLLDSPERFAFVGKPCDVSALRQLALHDPRVDERFPLKLSFFCGGIPSHSGAKRILDDLGVDEGSLASFRYRGDGWPGFATAVRKDGSSERMTYFESWGGRLSKTVQFRCKICPDAVGGVADVACADAWYGDERGYPLFEEQEGRSLLIGRTEAGEALIANALAAGAIRVEPVALAEIDTMQPSQARRKRLELSRLAALVATFQPLFRTGGLWVGAAARRAGAVETVKSFLGLVRRIVTNRR